MQIISIYTDGSKDKERLGCAVLRENDHQTMRIPDVSSVFTAEANTIDLALDLVDNCNSHDKFIFFLLIFSSTGLKSYFIQKPTDPKHFAKSSYKI